MGGKFAAIFGSTKPVIAMVHLGALPGSPLYDAEPAFEACRRRAQGPRRCRRRASTPSCSATRTTGPTNSRSTRPRPRPWPMSSARFATKSACRSASTCCGIRWRSMALAAATGARLRARDLHRHLCLRHGAVDAGCRRGDALPRSAAAAGPRAALQRLGRVRLFARPAAAWPTGRAARCSHPSPTRSWSPARSPARRRRCATSKR